MRPRTPTPKTKPRKSEFGYTVGVTVSTMVRYLLQSRAARSTLSNRSLPSRSLSTSFRYTVTYLIFFDKRYHNLGPYRTFVPQYRDPFRAVAETTMEMRTLIGRLERMGRRRRGAKRLERMMKKISEDDDDRTVLPHLAIRS